MTYETKKLYVTRDGHQAKIFMLDNGVKVMLGAVLVDGAWCVRTWNSEGICYRSSERDLVGEWREPRKCRHEIWIKPCKIDDGQNNLWDLLGITQYDTAKSQCCTIRAVVTMEEVPE